MAAESTYFIVTVVFLAGMLLFSLGLLFVRAEWIERNMAVGLSSLGTTLLAMGILAFMANRPGPMTGEELVSVVCVSLLGFGVGWILDRVAGPREEEPRVYDPATLGSDLAD